MTNGQPDDEAPQPHRDFCPAWRPSAFICCCSPASSSWGVVTRGLYPRVYLVFAALFMASAAGLDPAHALGLGIGPGCGSPAGRLRPVDLSGQHQAPGLVQGLLNLVFFLYLIRTEVRSRLR